MRTPSLYPQIEKDLKTISRVLHAEDDMFIEEQWREVKTHIQNFAAKCRATEEHRKKADGQLTTDQEGHGCLTPTP